MSETAPPPPVPGTGTPAGTAPFWTGVKLVFLRLIGTPLTALAIYSVISVALQENYPFSHFPMYSNPSPERPYYVLADGDGNPLPTATLMGITCPKIGKLYRTECQDVAKKLKLNKDKLPPEHKQAVGEKMFAYYRGEAAAHKQALPPKLQLIRREISYEGGKLSESSEIIAKE